MFDRTDLKGRWALVTGASSGLGVDFARELAALGCHLVLVARRTDRMLLLKDELETAHDIQVRTVSLDLANLDSPRRLQEEMNANGIQVDILVNNAGSGPFGPTLDLPWERERDMLMLNMITVVDLTKRFAKEMSGRGFGRILQIASIGAFQAVPFMAVYGASKAFVLSYGEALASELRGTGVSCTVLCPGYTATEFFKVGGQELNFVNRRLLMQSRDVVRTGLRALWKGRPLVIAGMANRLLVWSTRFVPRRLQTWFARKFVQQP